MNCSTLWRKAGLESSRINRSLHARDSRSPINSSQDKDKDKTTQRSIFVEKPDIEKILKVAWQGGRYTFISTEQKQAYSWLFNRNNRTWRQWNNIFTVTEDNYCQPEMYYLVKLEQEATGSVWAGEWYDPHLKEAKLLGRQARRKEVSQGTPAIVTAREDGSLDHSGAIECGEMAERFIWEVDSSGYANMGLRIKQESNHESQVFGQLDRWSYHFWDEENGKRKRFQRGIKSSVLHMLNMRFPLDVSGRIIKLGSLVKEWGHVAHALGSCSAQMWPLSGVWPGHPRENSKPTPNGPLSLQFCSIFPTALLITWHITFIFAYCPSCRQETRVSPPCRQESCPFAPCCISPEYLTCNRYSLVFWEMNGASPGELYQATTLLGM